MERILLLIAELGCSGPGRQLMQLARGLPRDRFRPHLCVLGKDGPHCEALRSDGIHVTCLGWSRVFDLKPFWELRRIIRSIEPAVVHSWGPIAARAAAFAIRSPVRWILSAPIAASERAARQWLDRRLLGRAECVVGSFADECRRCQDLGVPADRLKLIPFGIDPGTAIGAGASMRGIPANGRVLACIGPLDAHKGFRDAIWAFDILKYLEDDLHLVIAGTGPEHQQLADFAAVTASVNYIHFPGQLPSLDGLLARAEVVWVPRLAPGGVQVALEAMAAGKPIVGSRVPGLGDVAVERETAILIRPGDKPALARETRRLLENEEMRRRLGRAAQGRIRQHFAAAGMVEQYVRLYERAGVISLCIPPDTCQNKRVLVGG